MLKEARHERLRCIGPFYTIHTPFLSYKSIVCDLLFFLPDVLACFPTGIITKGQRKFHLRFCIGGPFPSMLPLFVLQFVYISIYLYIYIYDVKDIYICPAVCVCIYTNFRSSSPIGHWSDDHQPLVVVVAIGRVIVVLVLGVWFWVWS